MASSSTIELAERMDESVAAQNEKPAKKRKRSKKCTYHRQRQERFAKSGSSTYDHNDVVFCLENPLDDVCLLMERLLQLEWNVSSVGDSVTRQQFQGFSLRAPGFSVKYSSLLSGRPWRGRDVPLPASLHGKKNIKSLILEDVSSRHSASTKQTTALGMKHFMRMQYSKLQSGTRWPLEMCLSPPRISELLYLPVRSFLEPWPCGTARIKRHAFLPKAVDYFLCVAPGLARFTAADR